MESQKHPSTMQSTVQHSVNPASTQLPVEQENLANSDIFNTVGWEVDAEKLYSKGAEWFHCHNNA